MGDLCGRIGMWRNWRSGRRRLWRKRLLLLGLRGFAEEENDEELIRRAKSVHRNADKPAE